MNTDLASEGVDRGFERIGDAKLRPAFEALLDAFDCAQDTASDLWDFSVGIKHLKKLGLSETDLRWMVRKGYVAHAREVTLEGDDGRQFRSTGNLTFRKRSCFVLTEAGVSTARLIMDIRPLMSENGVGCRDCRVTQISQMMPHWDAETRLLSVNGSVVKRFKWQALNQEILLTAFQEEGWPPRIDDPLPPQPDQDPKRRLSDTIKCLNRKHVKELLHFRGDGTGEGVVWEFVQQVGQLQAAD